MTKACLALAFFCLALILPLRAFDWETATANGRDYVTLRSFCAFYGFYYEVPGGDYFTSRSAAHSIRLKLGTNDIHLDDVHYVMSFPIESGDHDWLISRMDVIKLFEPILRPKEIADRHPIRGVVIDPGHGGADNGAASSLGYEKNYTLDTAFILEGILRAAGLKTVLTRRTDVFVDLYERAHIASLYPDYVFVSIHYNSATPEAHGLETYCLAPRGAASSSSSYFSRADIYKLPGNDCDAQNILLASLVHSEIIRLNPGDPTADRGVKRARFVVIKQNVLPAILVEGGFVSNHFEARRVNRRDYRQRLAEEIARGIIRFANIMGDRNLPLPEETEPAPRPVPVAPPAPSGLAKDSIYGAFPKPSAFPSSTVNRPRATKTATAAPGHKPKKKKGTSVTGVPAHVSRAAQTSAPPISTPSSTPAPISSSPQTAGAPADSSKPAASPSEGPLNLNEPAPPPPSSVSDKVPASAEPDEPPTVSIYPTAPPGGSSAGSSSQAAAPPATNAAPPATPPSPSRP